MGKRDEMILLVRQNLEQLIREETEFVLVVSVQTFVKFLETKDLGDVTIKSAVVGVLPVQAEPLVAKELVSLSLKLVLGGLKGGPVTEEEL